MFQLVEYLCVIKIRPGFFVAISKTTETSALIELFVSEWIILENVVRKISGWALNGEKKNISKPFDTISIFIHGYSL